MRVVVIGADGFIGRHITFALRAAGHDVIASARRTERLAAMGFSTLRADLTDPATHDPAFWAPHLTGETHLVNAAGLLTGPERAFAAVHERAPRAAYAALDRGRAVLVSAVGIGADTPFARWRRRAESVARGAGQVTILRPGIVLADDSYGGSSLLRALSSLPFCRPLVGTGHEPMNPIHADDLSRVIAECLAAPPGEGPDEGAWEVGGPETLTQDSLTALLRRWLGLPPVPVLILPPRLARILAKLGDGLRIGPVSTTALSQLVASVTADPAPLLARIGTQPDPASRFLLRRPAGTQDLWQARLYLLKPLVRLALALMWLASGLLGLLLPAERFLPLVQGGPGGVLGDGILTALARGGGVLDLALAAALARNWRPVPVARAQFALVAAYTAGLTPLAPGLWLDPFGGILKNLPVLALILVHLALAEER